MSGNALSAASRFAGEMFLPPAVMMSSFLRSTILQVAVVVEHADVAGVQPAVVVEHLGGLLGVVEVAAEHVAAPADHLAVLGERDLAARDRRADGARPAPGTASHVIGPDDSDIP